MSNLTFNNLGTGVTPNSSYNGSSSVIVSYNTIGAAPISHDHSLIGLSDVLLNNLEEYRRIKNCLSIVLNYSYVPIIKFKNIVLYNEITK